ncbi:MAG: lantibiotic immunity ABC transporter MutE/EpiE family permease subunit [Clostridiales bacterium]|nr:lantibiotic immunity ABC transporter MutE/EpiE family permease subunit [Clostridiales bacterium]
MSGIVQAEILKVKYTFSLKLVFIAPISTILLGYFLGGSFFQYAAYNWWYTIILPVAVSIWCADIIKREKNSGLQNILCLGTSLEKIWLGKSIAVIIFLFAANLLMWIGCTVLGCFTTMNISTLNGMAGCMLLFLTYIWQVPFIMFIAFKAGYLAAVLLSFFANVLLFSVGVEKAWFFINPYAISARVVCPFFAIYPNGLLLENGSPLWNTDCIFPAVIVSLGVAVFMLSSSMILFRRLLSRG